MPTISTGDIALTTSFEAEAYDSHIAHHLSRSNVVTDYRLPIWGAWNQPTNTEVNGQRLGAFLLKNSYDTNTKIATIESITGAEMPAGSQPRFCFDFLEVDSLATINSLTFKIVCNLPDGTANKNIFIRCGDFETTQLYNSSETTITDSKATYEITVSIDDVIKNIDDRDTHTPADGDTDPKDAFGIWAELRAPSGTAHSTINLEVYHISAKLNYTGRTRNKTGPIIKTFAAANPNIGFSQWGTKGYGFGSHIRDSNSSIRNIRTQFGLLNGQVARGFAVNGLFGKVFAADGPDNDKLYYHTDSLSSLTYSSSEIDTSSIEIDTVNIKLWNHLLWNRSINENRVLGVGQSDFITTDPADVDTTSQPDQTVLKTSDTADVLNRYPSAIEDTLSSFSGGKRGWHIPEEVIVWDLGNQAGLTYSQLTNANFGVGNNSVFNDSDEGATVLVPWSNEENTSTNLYRSTATHFNCTDNSDNFCGAYTPDATKGHFTGNSSQGKEWIGGYAIMQVAYQEPVRVAPETVSASITMTTEAVVTHRVQALGMSVDNSVSALGGFKLVGIPEAQSSNLNLPDVDARIRLTGVSNLSTNIDVTQTGLAGMIRTGYTIDPSFNVNMRSPDSFVGVKATNLINFIGSPAEISSNLSFDATGLYGVLIGMSAAKMGTYTSELTTTQTAVIYKDPAIQRTFRPLKTRILSADTDDRKFELSANTRSLSIDSDDRKFELSSNTRVLDMRGTGD